MSWHGWNLRDNCYRPHHSKRFQITSTIGAVLAAFVIGHRKKSTQNDPDEEVGSDENTG